MAALAEEEGGDPRLAEDFLLNGVNIDGLKHVTQTLWLSLTDHPCIKGALFPSNEAERQAVLDTLKEAGGGSDDTWAPWCSAEEKQQPPWNSPWFDPPVVRVLKDDKIVHAEWARLEAGGEPQLLKDVVAWHVTGYDDQIPARMHTTGAQSVARLLLEQAPASAPYVGKATIFFSWALSAKPMVIIEVLERYLEENGLDRATTYFWFCNYCIAQNTARDAEGNAGREVLRLGEMVQSIRHTVMFLDPVDKSEALGRAWVIWELYHTAVSGGEFEAVMTQAEAERFVHELERNVNALANMFAHIDVRKADAHNKEDLARIMEEVDKVEGGANSMNAIVFERLRGWTVDVVRDLV